MIKYIAFFFLFLSAGLSVRAQEGRFDKEIDAFLRQDSAEFPLKGGILFIGSSSIRMWKDLDERFPGYHIINRGFGGSQLSDLLHYADRILLPYRPSKIFVYEGENDIAGGKSVEEVMEDVRQFHRLVSDSLPETKVYFISAKPSIRRQSQMPAMSELNKQIQDFIKASGCNWTFVDVFSHMLDKEGNPLPDIFINDKLHMNSKGYDIWEEQIWPYL